MSEALAQQIAATVDAFNARQPVTINEIIAALESVGRCLSDAVSQPSEATYGLELSFAGLYPTMEQEHAFVHGVEFGGLWSRMTGGLEAEIEATTHEANREVIARAAAAKGWEVQCKLSGTPTWDCTTLRKVRAERPNPHGLRLVK